MSEQYYTLASWRVRQGQEAEFRRLWSEDLARAFLGVNPDARGTLVQSLEDPQLYYSFGPWPSIEQIQRARAEPGTAQAFAKLSEVCEEIRPGAYKVVLTVP